MWGFKALKRSASSLHYAPELAGQSYLPELLDLFKSAHDEIVRKFGCHQVGWYGSGVVGQFEM